MVISEEILKMSKSINPKNDKPEVREKKESKSPSLLTISITKNAKTLALFAIICTGIVSLVNELTKDRIKSQQQQQLLKTLHSIIEPSRYDNNISQDCVYVNSPLLGTSNQQTAYIARKNNDVIAIAITTIAPDGYNGNISLIVGININNSISGVRVLNHQETPGLGDKIELRKSDWITLFSGKSLFSENDSRWSVEKDGGMFDQFTGATITPRAVIKAVKKAMFFIQSNKNTILSKANACIIDSLDDNLTEKLNYSLAEKSDIHEIQK